MTSDPICPTCEAPFFNNAVICPTCRNRLEQELAEVDSLLDDLDVTLTKQSQTRSQGGDTEQDATPTPFHVGASNAAGNLSSILTSWAALVQEETGHRYVGDGSSQSVASYLLCHVDWLANHEAAEDCYREVLDATAQCKRVVDIQPGRRIIGVCGSRINAVTCTETVWATEGHSTVRCRTCGAEWDVRERRLDSYLKATNTAQDTPTLTRAFNHDGIAVTTDRIYQWVRRGFLEPTRPGGKRFVVAHVAKLIQMSENREKLGLWEEKETAQ
jgi:uncharacterized Zn finger protein (UPF0148 family)